MTIFMGAVYPDTCEIRKYTSILIIIHRHVSSTIVQVVYGHEVSGDPMEDTLIKQAEQAAKLTTATGSIGGTIDRKSVV